MNNTKLSFPMRIFHLLRQLVDRMSYSKDLFSEDVWVLRISKLHQRNNQSAGFRRLSFRNPDAVYRSLFILMMVAMLIVMPLMSRNVGISTREMEQHHYSELVYDHFHHSGNADAYKDHPFASTQAQIIDLIIYSLCKTLHIGEVFLVRHLLSALFGWLLILYLSILILRAFNWRAAFFTAFFLFISPRFFGYSLSNVVDVTFAFGFIFTITQMYYFCRELPTIRIYRVVKIILGTLLALSTYNAGFVLIHFFIVFTLLNFLLYNPIKKFFKWEYLKVLLQLGGIVCGISLLILIIHNIATFFLIESTVRPGHAFELLAINYPFSVIQLFSGHEIGPDNFPRRYLIHWLFITIPSVILIGIPLFLIFFKTAVRQLKPYSIFIFLYAFCYCLIQVKNHYLNPDTAQAIGYIIYPLFMLIAVSGFECALLRIQDRYTNFVIVGIILLLSVMPIRHIAFNQPMTSLYFNELSGGIHNAYAKYELDFNSQSNKTACEQLRTYIAQHEVDQHAEKVQYIVATNGNEACDLFFAGDTNCVLIHMPHLATDTCWDYYLYFCQNVPSAQLRNGTWPAENTVQTINIENKPIVAFYKNSYREAQRLHQDSIAQAMSDSLTALMEADNAELIEK